MQKFEVEGHEPSLLPDNKKWKLVWNDEFDGDTLDTSKWGFRRGLMHTRYETYTDEGVTVKDGCVHIGLVEKDGEYYSAQLQTGSNFMDNPPDTKYCKFTWPIASFEEQRFLHKYGYYECRCKTTQKMGWMCAFWLQSPIIGCCADPSKAGVEVDILESFEARMIPHYIHWDGYGKDHKFKYVTEHQTEFAPDRYSIPAPKDGFHTYAVEWSPEGYSFYIDGVFDGHHDGPVSDTEQFILISTECNGYRVGKVPYDELKNAMGDEFVVDYVRVFDEVK